MIVSTWMTRNVVTVTPETLILDAASIMAAKRIRWLPVVRGAGDGRRLVGMLSAADVLHAFPAHVNPFGLRPETYQIQESVAKFMKPDPPVVHPDDPVEDAAKLMRDEQIGALSVLRGQTLIGIITESDIFRAFVSIFELPPGGARITFDVSRGEDTLSLVTAAAQKHGIRVMSFIRSQRDEKPVSVVWTSGDALDAFVEDLWHSGHHVLNVLRLPPASPGPVLDAPVPTSN